MWEHTPFTKDKPLCAGMMMEDGDSPGCPSRLNNVPSLRVSHRDAEDRRFVLCLRQIQASKMSPSGLWYMLPGHVPTPHSLPDTYRCGSILQLDNYLPQARCTLLLCVCWDTWFYLLHVFSIIRYSLLTGSYQSWSAFSFDDWKHLGNTVWK